MARIRFPSHNMARTMIDGIAELANADYNNAIKTFKNSHSYLSLDKTPIENRFTLPKELFEAVDFTDMGVVEEPKNALPRFIIGEKYALKGVSCEGFEMPEKVYQLVSIHDEFCGINLNSLIVKQISGDQDKIFTLSKNDCEHIGIEYENGLQLFPKHLNWQRIKDIVQFDPSNLGTTPLSNVDNTIRYVLLRLNGFKDYADGYVVTPSGKIIKEKQFEKTLRIVSDEPIVYSNPTNNASCIKREENVPLNVKVVYPKGLAYNHGNFISSDDTVYVLIDLSINVDLASSIDYKIGVPKEFLEGFNPNNHFSISWDELGAYTVEEYEAEKIERQKRIAEKEAERQKKIAEEEKRIKEQRRRAEETVTKMRNALQEFPKMPKFNMDNGISSLNLYMDSLDVYFNTLDKSLTQLSRDLTQMSKNVGVNTVNASTLIDMINF